jgi:hypothetical protein
MNQILKKIEEQEKSDEFQEVKRRGEIGQRVCPRGFDECPYKDCTLGIHNPDSKPFRFLIPCDKGDNCPYYETNNCRFGHEEPRMCCYNNECTRVKCAYNHPYQFEEVEC